jgi:plastocyanin
LLRVEGTGVVNHQHHLENSAIAGHGETAATGGGSDSLSVMRFSNQGITVHAGDTVEWTNDDPTTAHTITFGPEPQDLVDPSSNVTVDADGARHGVLNSPSDAVHSGFIQAAPQDRTGLAQGAFRSNSLPRHVQRTRDLSLHLLAARCLGYERKRGRSSLDVGRNVPAGAVIWTRPLPISRSQES